MRLWILMLMSFCLLISACTSTRNIYEAIYNTLQLHAKAEKPKDEAPFLDSPISFQQYEAERKKLIESQDISTKKSP